jgi:transposase InsO family protein
MPICGPPVERGKKAEVEKKVRRADEPGQAVNVDLCFVPVLHEKEAKLPAVSGSSGRLVIESFPVVGEVKRWPGQVFAEAELSYEAVMHAYAQQTRDRLVRGKLEPLLPEKESTAWRRSWEVRAQRHAVLQHRRQEDAQWRTERQAHHQIVDAYRALTRKKRAEQGAEWQAQKEHWAQREQTRRDRLFHRQAENQAWHQSNRSLLQKNERFWLAILVVTDNCSRQCLGLPIFEAGAKVTAGEVEQALQTLLPKDLAFLISDQGTHLRSKALARLAHETGFIQIPIYRHRPQTNGIAERFVRSLKEWLRDFAWIGPVELAALLARFCSIYNNRPHQGLPIPGLSPNEFANRLWLM